jgi:hypothetical protein
MATKRNVTVTCTCDRCGDVVPEQEPIAVVYVTKFWGMFKRRELDLCEPCYDGFRAWLELGKKAR